MIAAVVLAAGQSLRMGRPKMTLPWGETTVIGQVVSVLLQAGVEKVLVVTGGAREAVEAALATSPAQTVFNLHFETSEMLESLQLGLKTLPDEVEAALVVLGDQPQIEPVVVESILERYHATRSNLIIPSYQHRRGHPWLVARPLWNAIETLEAPATLREFLNRHSSQILYETVTTSSVLLDLDTPADYQRYQG